MGLAVGDALGAAVEFFPPAVLQRRPVRGYQPGSPHGIRPGEWTDDTSLALALADSITCAGWDLNDQMRRYLSWRDQGQYSVIGRCFDIGVTTCSSLQRFKASGDARASGDKDEYSSGNGSLMRLAPVPIRYAHLFPDRLEELSRLAAESSLTTHATEQCLSACRYLALLLCALIYGVDREEMLAVDAARDWVPLQRLQQVAPLHPRIAEIAEGSFRRKEPPEIRGTGYVVDSLEAALWAFHRAGDFREAVLRAVNLGNDADTTGAVCGQLAGACWGESGIPLEWRDGLARRDMIERALEGLLSPVRRGGEESE